MNSPILNPEAVGHAIRGHYRKAKEARTGRRYTPDARHDRPETWLKAGDACIAAGANPADWVQAAFAQCNHKGGPFANMLTGASATAWYRLHHGIGRGTQTFAAETPLQIEDLKDTIITAHTIMLNHSGSSRVGDNRAFLGACYFPFEPWLRVLIACCRTEFFPEVLAEYGEQARRYFEERPNTVRMLTELGYNLDVVMRHTSAPPSPQR